MDTAVSFAILFPVVCTLPGPSYMLKNGKICVSFLSRPTEPLSMLAGTHPYKQLLKRSRNGPAFAWYNF